MSSCGRCRASAYGSTKVFVVLLLAWMVCVDVFCYIFASCLYICFGSLTISFVVGDCVCSLQKA